MAKIKIKLERICRIIIVSGDGGRPTPRAPFFDSLRAARRQVLPARTFYWLNKISHVLEKEFEDYEAARSKLVQQLGEATPVGYAVKAENNEEFARQMAELNHEVELPIEEGLKLELPANGVGEDWFLLMGELDIFAEPTASEIPGK